MFKEAIKLIGANIQIYGHFQSYTIPNEDGNGIMDLSKITKDGFLKLTYDYYNSNRLNKDFFAEIGECNSVKRFIKRRVNTLSYEIGEKWLEEQSFKD